MKTKKLIGEVEALVYNCGLNIFRYFFRLWEVKGVIGHTYQPLPSYSHSAFIFLYYDIEI